MLAAFDDAIADGVDVVSFSIEGKLPAPYFEDAAARSFHAMRRGVLTSAAAGNFALFGGCVCNVAPWMLSVAASSTDRRLVDKLVLGNGKTIVRASINIFPKIEKAPLAIPINGSCGTESLAGQSYKRKIHLCDRGSNGTGPLLAGAAGVVVVTGEPDIAFAFPLPALAITQDQFTEILAYVNRTCKPVGTVHRTEATFDSKAPAVASFSSRGPNLISTGILKPDLSAPGIDILAAWTPVSSNLKGNRFATYNIISGTSMACPHATGVAAYVKSFHPDWSPAMIMSGLMTTATPMDPALNPGGGELVYGAGRLNPARARGPGHLRAVTGNNATACPAGGKRGGTADLNYPTMAHRALPGKNFTVHFPRTVTTVGAPGSVYTAKIVSSGPFIRVAVAPRKLVFSRLLQKLSFTVTARGALPAGNEFVSAAVVWSAGVRHAMANLGLRRFAIA
ncbi:Subtilisin-like protease SBT4.6 [Dichanthelium oligosanthes]|uniref:Subtilisin-like protease SBT4.6 n=1 Tax=Dichanthelium oligosanthes TaxID=888268 RepID=A0A1E5VH20_9POAL|nr:Subtilisin-like protease SBT4.6 [Dichanthelium oligosanthes]